MENTGKRDSLFVRIFTNDTFILSVIGLFTIQVIIQEFEISHWSITMLNMACTLIFLLEMIAKHMSLGLKGYWSDWTNVFDGTLVILAVGIIAGKLIFGSLGGSVLMVLRVLRIFRVFRILKAFKDLKVIGRNFLNALRKCSGLFASFGVIILVIALLCCSLFRESAPEYFGDPFASVFTIFRLFTIEGWYEIPDTIADRVSELASGFVRFFFAMLLILGGVIGMSLINSVFVDEMVADNNDDMKEDIRDLKSQIAEMNAKMEKLLEMQGKKVEKKD